MEIMKLTPTGKDYLWGGTRLRKEYGKKIDLNPLAETWECSVHPDGPSYVANGIYKGQTLAEVLSAHPEYLGTKVENGKLPVLVKFIDAKKDLSVQVHPNDEYARAHEGDNGKTEMWYVIDADEGASLIYGFQHEVTEEILRKAIETGTLGKHLQKVPVHKGNTHFVPAGTVHGIGKGTLVAEIQESSNVTYRVYDYDRVDKNEKKRELHFDKAVQVMNMKVIRYVFFSFIYLCFYPSFVTRIVPIPFWGSICNTAIYISVILFLPLFLVNRKFNSYIVTSCALFVILNVATLLVGRRDDLSASTARMIRCIAFVLITEYLIQFYHASFINNAANGR